MYKNNEESHRVITTASPKCHTSKRRRRKRSCSCSSPPHQRISPLWKVWRARDYMKENMLRVVQNRTNLLSFSVCNCRPLVAPSVKDKDANFRREIASREAPQHSSARKLPYHPLHPTYRSHWSGTLEGQDKAHYHNHRHRSIIIAQRGKFNHSSIMRMVQESKSHARYFVAPQRGNLKVVVVY